MPTNQKETGLDILNVGKGHAEIRFNNEDPVEIERAKRIITDMLRRGYVLFIEGEDKKLARVERFDATKGVYIIADLGEPEPIKVETDSAEGEVQKHVTATAVAMPEKRGKGRPRTKEVPMTSVKTTAIGRTAGG